MGMRRGRVDGSDGAGGRIMPPYHHARLELSRQRAPAPAGNHCARSCSGLGSGNDSRSASARSSLPGRGSPITAAVTTSAVGMLDRFNGRHTAICCRVEGLGLDDSALIGDAHARAVRDDELDSDGDGRCVAALARQVT